MNRLRLIVLGLIAVALVGCGAGKKDKASVSKPGARSGQSSPTYPWKRPPDDVPQPPPATKPGDREPF